MTQSLKLFLRTPILLLSLSCFLTTSLNQAGELRAADKGSAHQVVFQDWQLTQGQRTGWRSQGYQEPYFAAQETRVHRFHEVLNDYLAGKPPGRE